MLKNNILTFTKTSLSIYRVIKDLRYKTTCLPNVQGKELFILGTGPSLKEDLLHYKTKLEEKEILAVNKFCMQDVYIELKPKHYVLLDVDFIMKDAVPELQVMRKKVFTRLIDDTKWILNLYLPSNSDMQDELIQLFSQNPLINIVFYNMTTLDGSLPVVVKLIEKGYGLPYAGNVLIAAITLAINLGYTKIVLMGADLSMHSDVIVDKKNRLCLKEINFYSNQTEYIPMNARVHDYYLQIAQIFEAFNLLQKYADYRNIEIVNCSVSSYIDSFVKEEVKNVLDGVQII